MQEQCAHGLAETAEAVPQTNTSANTSERGTDMTRMRGITEPGAHEAAEAAEAANAHAEQGPISASTSASTSAARRPASVRWQRFIGGRFVAAGLAYQDPDTGEVSFPNRQKVADRTGISYERLFAYVKRGELPTPKHAKKLADVLGGNVFVYLYQTGAVTLDDFAPIYAARGMHLLTQHEYDIRLARIARIAEHDEELAAWTAHDLEFWWAYSRWVADTLRVCGLSEREIVEFLEKMNTQAAKDEMRADLTGQPYRPVTPPALPEDYRRELPPARPRRPTNPSR